MSRETQQIIRWLYGALKPDETQRFEQTIQSDKGLRVMIDIYKAEKEENGFNDVDDHLAFDRQRDHIQNKKGLAAIRKVSYELNTGRKIQTSDLEKAKTILHKADKLSEQLKYDIAIVHYKEAETLFRALSKDIYVFRCANGRLRCRYFTAPMDDLAPIAEEARRYIRHAQRRIGEFHPETGELYMHLGIIEDIAGQGEQAISTLNKSAAIFEAHGNMEQERLGKCLMNLGIAYDVLGNPIQALEEYRRSEAAFIKAKDTGKRLSKVWDNMGWVHAQLGEYREAERLYQKAIKETKKHFGKTYGSLAGTYDNYAVVLSGLRQFKKARSYHNQSMALFPKDSYSYYKVVLNVASTYQKEADYRHVIATGEKAWSYFKAYKDKQEYYVVSSILGSAWYQLGDYEKANVYLEEAIHIEGHEQKLTFSNLMIYAARNNIALKQYDEAIAVLEKVILNMTGNTSEELDDDEVKNHVGNHLLSHALSLYYSTKVQVAEHKTADTLPLLKRWETAIELMESVRTGYTSVGRREYMLDGLQTACQSISEVYKTSIQGIDGAQEKARAYQAMYEKYRQIATENKQWIKRLSNRRYTEEMMLSRQIVICMEVIQQGVEKNIVHYKARLELLLNRFKTWMDAIQNEHEAYYRLNYLPVLPNS